MSQAVPNDEGTPPPFASAICISRTSAEAKSGCFQTLSMINPMYYTANTVDGGISYSSRA